MYSFICKQGLCRQRLGYFVKRHFATNQVSASYPTFRSQIFIKGFSSKSKNYYEILGVKSNANQEAIKTAYFKLSKLHHPDIAKDNADSAERFREATEAYEILNNTQSRKQYDDERFKLHDLKNSEERTKRQKMKRKMYVGQNYIFNEWFEGHYAELYRMEYEKFNKRLVFMQLGTGITIFLSIYIYLCYRIFINLSRPDPYLERLYSKSKELKK